MKSTCGSFRSRRLGCHLPTLDQERLPTTKGNDIDLPNGEIGPLQNQDRGSRKISGVHACRVGRHTHTDTCDVGAHCVQEWDHMSALGDCTFNTRIERIAGEECQDIRLPGKVRVRAVIVYKGLKP